MNGPTISKEVRLVLFKIKMKYEFKDFFLFRRGEKSIKWIPTEQERNLLICNICSSVASEVCVVSIFFCTVDSQMIKDLKEWYLTKCCRKIICCTCNLLIDIYTDISKYAGPSDLTGKNQAGPTMFSAYLSESPVKICSLLWSGNNFLFVFKSRSFLQ